MLPKSMIVKTPKGGMEGMAELPGFARALQTQGGVIVQQLPDATALPTSPDQITAVCEKVGDDFYLTGLSSALGAADAFQARVFRPVASGTTRMSYDVLRVVTVEPGTELPVLLVTGVENPFFPVGQCRITTQWYPDNKYVPESSLVWLTW
jgi:hypothetical protein